MYKTLMVDIILAAKRRNKKNTIGALDIGVEQTIAVIMLSAALGDATDSGDESPVVLIDQQLVNKLGLHICNLKKPLPVSVAMLGKKKQELSLSQYVKLSCMSLDLHYRLHTVRAVVTPNLCSLLLLGDPFPEHNKIVIDHELQACIAKDQNYDLLNPSHVMQQKPRALCEDLPRLYDFKKVVVAELNHILLEYKEIVDKSCDAVKEVVVVANIEAMIASLACKNELKERQCVLEDFSKCNDTVKGEFSDCFPDDILHNDSLPSDILFHVQHKDTEKIIQDLMTARKSITMPGKY
ncbi:hypothetical protein PAXRUDRAFT_24198 [Paxillus rubicundulus Ve08.2h10]|uniref:Uncharacterized protein n=1 Tax=Paxillus rubicundulus Ve08.2h10 TaxID=930991 RepID=A0A0D0E2Y5_9AGAM|nr:hypothetical protein PAXRUDRAFT_24198 [Paxillus rubicundulus Ve08.2h10]